MKEYICKDELLKREWDINHSNVPFNFVDVCPTVTKADICREIIANVENEVIATQIDYKEALYRILEYLETGRWDYTILAEMEQCE